MINERKLKVKSSKWNNINVLGMDYISMANSFKADYGREKFVIESKAVEEL